MDTMMNAVAMLAATLLLAIAIDRGIPNSLDATAYWLERCSRAFIAFLRFTANKLRERHLSIEKAERERQGQSRELQSDFIFVRE